MDETSFKVQQNVEVLQNYAMQKTLILNKIKGTFLFPYLLNMQYMVGTIENVKVTEDPIDELAPYLNTIEGINRTLKVNFNRENLIDWEIFKLEVFFTQTDWAGIQQDKYTTQDNPGNFKEMVIYLLLKFSGQNLNLLIFGIIEGKIIPQEKVQYFLDNDAKILETKKELGI